MNRMGYFVLFVAATAAATHVVPLTAAGSPPSVSVRRLTTLDAVVLTGDLNGDGKVDAVAHDIRPGLSEIVVQLGRGDGTFNAVIRTGMQANALALGDVNKDGRLDLIVHPLDESRFGALAVMPGKGDGTFAAPVRIGTATTLAPTFGLTADVDGDGNLDVLVGNIGEASDDAVLVYPGRGDGTFGDIVATLAMPGAAAGPRGGAVADLNGDGKGDVVVANHDAHIVSVFLNHGSFTFAASDVPLDRQANDVAATDLNHDGKMDLLVATTHAGADDLYYIDGFVYVLLGNGDGTFGSPTSYRTDRGAFRIVLDDFNRDGVLDVATANHAAKQSEDSCGFLWDTISILPGNANATFAAASTFSLGDQNNVNDFRYRDSVQSLAAADLNGDHQPDLVASQGGILINQAPDTNWAPKVTAKSSAPSSTHTIVLEAIASDVDQDALSYRWTDSGGRQIEPTATPCQYTATDTGIHTFTVTVDDRHGHSASSSVIVDFGGSGGTTPGTVTVTAPAPGATLQAGTPFAVQWTASGDLSSVAHWILQVTTDGTHFSNIAECANVAASARSCTWNSPGPATAAAQIIVTNGSETNEVGGISGRFAIAGASGGVIGDGWSHADVGPVGAAGTATFDGFVFDGEGLTVSGSGADIWGTADEFHYAWKPMTGDFSIDTMVESVQNVNAWTKAGLMVRANATDARSPHASIFVTPGKGVVFQRRTAEGGTSVSNQGPIVAAPMWLRLVRVGDVLTAYYKKQLTDSWTSLGQQGVSGFGSTVNVGLAVTSHADGKVAQAVFKGVYLAPLPVLTTHLFNGATGSASNDGTIHTVHASGTDIWGTSDSFLFLSTALGSSRQITARVRLIGNTDAWAKAGVMIRDTVTASSTHADAVVTPGKGIAMQYRSATGGSSANVVIIGGAAPVWLRIRRFDTPSSGVNAFSTWYSTDRLIWRRLGDVSLSSASAANIRLAVTSHHAGVETTAVFDDVRIEP